MRYLLLTRGMPFCGKTTWIQQHNLQAYTLDSKLFKKLFHSPMLNESGAMTYDVCNNDKIAFQTLFTALESRMVKGDFIIIEDNHITKSYFSNYKEMAKMYAYKIFIVDFSDVSLETIKQRNKDSQSIDEALVTYTESELQELYDELHNTQIPIKCDVIEPSEITKFLSLEPRNLNGYSVIHHIGDIQGSYSVVEKYIGKLKDNEFYIFLGDYIDRGFQNYEVLKFLLSIMDKKNVCLLEGNHEKWLWDWANEREIDSKEFKFNTQTELEQKGFSKHDAKRLYHRLIPYFFYKFHDKRVICTHGGISNVPEHPILLSAMQSIHGVGGYLNTSVVAESFAKNAPENYYQLFGHRNKTDLPICLYEKNFLLESKVEYGGFLRTIELSQQGFKDTSIRNTIFVSKEEKEAKNGLQKFFSSFERNENMIITKTQNLASLQYPKKKSKEILESEYTFSPCIIDTKQWQITARGYSLQTDKTTQFTSNTQEYIDSIHFPLSIINNIHGIQAVLSYYNGSFLYFVDSILQDSLPHCIQSKHVQQEIIQILKNQSHSLLLSLETKNNSFLIDSFANTPQPHQYCRENIEKIAKTLQLQTTKILYTIYDKKQFKEFLTQFNHYNLRIAQKLSLHKNDLEYFSLQTQGERDSLTHICSENSLEHSHLHTDSIPNRNEDSMQDSSQIHDFYELFYGFRAFDAVGNYFDLPTYYTNELKALKHFVKIWIVQENLSKLQWINNPFREAFYEWFQDFAKNTQWRNIPITWIQNEFLHFFIKNKES